MTNSSGTIVWQQSFDPWGVPTTIVSTTPADMGYAGYYLHSRSGLNLTLYRAYSAGLGRWISREPFGELLGANLYKYVENDPLGSTDPSGLQPQSPFPFCPVPPWKDPNRGKCADGTNPVHVQRAAFGDFYLCRGDNPITPGRPGYNPAVDTAYGITKGESAQATEARHEADIKKFEGFGNDVQNAYDEAKRIEKEQHQKWQQSQPWWNPFKYF